MKTSLNERLWSRVEVRGQDDCWPWLGCRTKFGHGQIQSETPGVLTYSHRAAFQSVNGAIPRGMSVCHRCDNPSCCNPAHLFLGTQADNNRDCFTKKRSVHFVARDSFPKGEKSHLAKVTDEQASEIVRRVQSGEPRAAVASAFSITVSAISKMIVGKSRKHLQLVSA